MNKRVLWIFAILAVISTLVGYMGRTVPFHDQWPRYQDVQFLASLIFGIAGAWSFLVSPDAIRAVFATKPEQYEANVSQREINTIRRLTWAVCGASLIVAVVLLVGLAAPILQQYDWLAAHVHIARGTSYGLLSFLFLSELLFFVLSILILLNFRVLLEKWKERDRKNQPVSQKQVYRGERSRRPVGTE